MPLIDWQSHPLCLQHIAHKGRSSELVAIVKNAGTMDSVATFYHEMRYTASKEGVKGELQALAAELEDGGHHTHARHIRSGSLSAGGQSLPH